MRPPSPIAAVALAAFVAAGCATRPPGSAARRPRPDLAMEGAWERALPSCPQRIELGADPGIVRILGAGGALGFRMDSGDPSPEEGTARAEAALEPGVESIVGALAPAGTRTATVVWGGYAYFVLADAGLLQAVDLQKRKLSWAVRAGAGAVVAPQLQEDQILFQSLDNYLYLLKARNGHEVWRARAAGRLSRPAAFWSGRALVIAENSDRVEAFDLRGGSRVGTWGPEDPRARFIAGPLAASDRLVAVYRAGDGGGCVAVGLGLSERSR